MTVNTVISGNIPSSIQQFLRQPTSSREEPVEYEKILDHTVTKSYENEIVVDNEDPGFSYTTSYNETKLKKYIQSRKKMDEKVTYSGADVFPTPKKWTPVTSSGLYGQVILSAMVTSGSNTGDQVARWTAKLPSSTLYNVYVYLPVSVMREPDRGRRRGGGQDGGRSGNPGQGGGQQRSGGPGGGPTGGNPSGGGFAGRGPGGRGMGDRMQGMVRFTDEGSEYNYSIKNQ